MRRLYRGYRNIITVLVLVIFSMYSGAEEFELLSHEKFINRLESLKNAWDVSREENSIDIMCAKYKKLKLYILSDSIIRVRVDTKNGYLENQSYAVVKKDFGKVPFTYEENDDSVIIDTKTLHLNVSKETLKITVSDKSGNIINEDDEKGIEWDGQKITAKKKLSNESLIYGFGEKTGSLVKNGRLLQMWNTDAYGYGNSSEPLYSSIPFFIEVNPKYTLGVLFDNTYQSFYDIGNNKKNQYFFGAVSGEMDYYLIYGKEMKDVIEKYTGLTGRMYLPPKWALGYQQSKYSYESDKIVRNIADTLRQEKIPADVIYLDIHFMDKNKSFTWDKKNYPDVKKMAADLHTQGFKLITIIDPGMKIEKGYDVYESGIKENVFVKTKDGKAASGTVWPGKCVFPDFTDPKAKAWWGLQYKKLVDAGIDGFWNDMNEPSIFDTKYRTLPLDSVHYDFGNNSPHAKIHNVYGQEMVNATYNGLLKINGNKRNFVLSRAGYAGIQRYAAVWTGDNTANWEHLKLNLTMSLNMGMSGIPMTGADVGGYVGNPSPELFARWMAMASFSPLFRNHTSVDNKGHEPWRFGKEAEDAVRKYINMRYRMLQYLYDTMYTAHTKGLPPMRPLMMEFADDKETYKIEDQFMLGESILVAPVLEEGMTARKVYLPKGADWFEYETGKRLEGGKWYNVSAPLDKVPLFIKEGGIIPMIELQQYVGEKEVNPITLEIYPGNGTYLLHLDDGTTLDYTKGRYRDIEIKGANNGKTAEYTLTMVKNGYSPKEKYMDVKFNQMKKPSKITVNGKGFTLSSKESFEKSLENGAYYNEESQELLVRLSESNENKSIKVE